MMVLNVGVNPSGILPEGTITYPKDFTYPSSKKGLHRGTGSVVEANRSHQPLFETGSEKHGESTTNGEIVYSDTVGYRF